MNSNHRAALFLLLLASPAVSAQSLDLVCGNNTISISQVQSGAPATFNGQKAEKVLVTENEISLYLKPKNDI